MPAGEEHQIPYRVIAAVADVLSTHYHSHSKLKHLFVEAGAPGEPPAGNCETKCELWLKRCNETPGVDAFEVLGLVIQPFMEKDIPQEADEWRKGRERIENALSREGLHYEEGQIIYAIGKPPPRPKPFREVVTPAEEPMPEPTKEALLARVFIVHGHDDGLKNTVARYVTMLGLEAVVLHEQPSKGATLIEKFEKHSNSEFAIVLATADDVGGKVGSDEQARARQNVVFELGFFVGKLGRDRVVLIVDKGVEMPSDFAGVIYIRREEWAAQLWHALADAGFKFTPEQIRKATAIVL